VNIHTRLVGALDAIILSLTAAVTVLMMLVLLVPSFARFDMLAPDGTVTIRQLAVDEAIKVRHM
jgi:hypothetical protein